MRIWSFGYTLILCAAELLAGCGGGSQLPIATPQGGAQSVSLRASSGIDDVAKYSVIHAFRYSDGDWPQMLVQRNGDIFGETLIGGDKTCGCGLVFKLSPSGAHYDFSILHVFTGGTSDGAAPNSLIASSSGAFYGSTDQGGGTGCSYSGVVGCGIVFKLTPSGSGYTYTILYRFKGGADARSPGLATGQTISDGGPIFGVAGGGARKNCSCGILFKLVRSGNAYSKQVLWNFGGNPGENGPGGSAMLIDGKLYGTAHGTGDVDSYVYRFDSGHLTVLHKFRQSDAKNGTGAALTVSDPAGNLYGSAGGGHDRCFFGKARSSCGIIWELVATGGRYTERVLHRFSPGPDGWPGGVSVYHNGALYGGAGWGANKCDGQQAGCGALFSLSTRTGKETVLYRFVGGFRGAHGGIKLISPSENAFYGLTLYGGYHNAGTIFRLTY